METEAFVAHVAEAVRDVEPEEGCDWPPALFMDLEERGGGVVALALDELGEVFANDRAKNALSSALAGLIQVVRPQRVAFVSTAWMLLEHNTEEFRKYVEEHGKAPSTYDEGGLTPPSQHPDRVEIVMAAILEPEEHVEVVSKIERPEGETPRLGEFRPMHELLGIDEEDASKAQAAGRFVEPLQEALREANRD